MTMSVIPQSSGGGGPVNAVLTTPQRIIVASDNISTTDRVLLCQQVGPINLQLPTGAADTVLFIFKDFDGTAITNPITIVANGLDTIEGAATYTMDVDFMSLMVACDGAGRYFVI